jgi:hypothetical protein
MQILGKYHDAVCNVVTPILCRQQVLIHKLLFFVFVNSEEDGWDNGSEGTITAKYNEILRAGDVIYFEHPMPHMGYYSSTVLQVRPKEEFKLRLEHLVVLENHHPIKVMKKFLKGELMDNPNPKWREIVEFILIESAVPDSRQRKSVEAQQLERSQKRLSVQYQSLARAMNMPTDLMYSNNISSSGSDDTL